MGEHNTKADERTAVAVPALLTGEAWFDPIEAGLRERVRGFIEALLEEELTAALGGRAKHERAAATEPPRGYRNGTRERQLLGGAGARFRPAQPGGMPAEGASARSR